MQFKENRLAVLYYPPHISNTYGRYWAWMHRVVLAHSGSMKPRAGSYTDPWGSELDPIMNLPKLEHTDVSLQALLDERASELYQYAVGVRRRIYMMWSGGIDSTGVLTAFLRNLTVSQQEIITVVYSASSIEENPVYWNNHIKDKLTTLDFDNFVITQDFLKAQGIVLTGDPGDALFGPSSVMYADLLLDNKHLKKFKDSTNLIAFAIEKRAQDLIKQHNLVGIGKWYVSKVTDNLLEVNPAGVETIADWWWWHYINLKWETSIWRPFIRSKRDYHESFDQTTIDEFVTNTFFNTAKFHSWSYSNRHRFILNNDISTHKHEIKKYIYDYDRNRDYLQNKTKQASFPPVDIKKFPSYVNWAWQGQVMNPELEAKMVDVLEQYKG